MSRCSPATKTLSDTRDKLWDRYKDIRETTDAKGLYNGNISWMSTDLPGLTDRMQAMVYGYDQLHRIPDTLRYRDRLCRPGALRNMGPLAMHRGIPIPRHMMWAIPMMQTRTERKKTILLYCFSEGPECRGG